MRLMAADDEPVPMAGVAATPPKELAGSTNHERSSMVKRTLPKATVATLAIALALNFLVLRPSAVSAASLIPFQAVVSETYTAGPCGPAIVCITAVGRGQATQLGEIVEHALVVVDVNPADAVNGCAPETRTTTLTAANGDNVMMYGTGLTRCPGSNEANDNFVITGGTGHFEGATGGGREANVHTFTGPGVGVATVWYDGNISSVGSLNR